MLDLQNLFYVFLMHPHLHRLRSFQRCAWVIYRACITIPRVLALFPWLPAFHLAQAESQNKSGTALALHIAEQKNAALVAKIAMLEQQAVQKEKEQGEHAKQSAQMNDLLAKTLSRVDQLESSLQKGASENKGTENVKGSSSKGEKKNEHVNVQPRESQSVSAGKDDQSSDESDSEEVDETCMHTPGGVKVLWIQLGIPTKNVQDVT